MNRQFEDLRLEFQQTLSDCRNLYIDAAQLCASQHPELLPDTPAKFVRLMDDLHRGLLVKTYVCIAEADRSWSKEERLLAKDLVLHVWGKLLDGKQLKQTMVSLSGQAVGLKWFALVRPFGEIEPLRDRIGRLETIVIRFANLVAKADGHLNPAEARVLHSLQEEMDRHLRSIPYAEGDHDTAQQRGSQAVVEVAAGAQKVRQEYHLPPTEQETAEPVRDAAVTLEQANGELQRLIGLGEIKHEIASLVNYLLLQKKRSQAGLPPTQLSLHSYFTGNPGTGKTTVARIVGNILGAMGILKQGHVIETDRSGLVAEFAGQTGPKSNKKIDEALDGILFVDEAYTLVGEGTDDPYGHEAVQTLLKRMEDDRDRLVVILAGYPKPIQRLLDSNPGLRSRFSRQVHFEDYAPRELGQIFELLCDQNHYRLPWQVRAKFHLAMQWLYDHRDEHFGNGRLVRNIFEDAIRRLANRIADVTPVTRRLLTELVPDDLDFPSIPADAFESLEQRRFRVACPGCQQQSVVPARFLSRRVECPCGTQFKTGWGELL
jgi:AAA+ superfamily predicted ATPase